jgi:hypothetical protein
MMLERLTVIVRLAALLLLQPAMGVADAQPRIAFVEISCKALCKFTLGEPDAAIGTVSAVVAPLGTPFTGSFALSGTSAAAFRLIGAGCSGGRGDCTLVTAGAPNASMPHPVEYHVIITATQPSLQGSPFSYEYKIAGLPKGWMGRSY